MKLGLTFYSVLKMPIPDIIELSRLAESAGFEYICVAESFFRDGFALACSIAAATEKVRFGTSIMPIFTRTPFQLAMGAATLQEASSGRLGFLGLGVGYRQRTQFYFGLEQKESLLRMREYVEMVRGLLKDEKTTYHGRFFRSDGFPRPSEKPIDVPIYVGCSGPKMLELAGMIADGVILNSISTDGYVAFARERIAAGARSAGRRPSDVTIGHSIVYSVSDNEEEAMDAAKQDVAFYLAYPELDPVLRFSSFGDEAREIRELYYKGEKKEAVSHVTEEMLEAFTVYGTPKQCVAGLKKFVRRGVELPIIRVSSPHGDPQKNKLMFVDAIHSLEGFGK